MIIGAHTLGKPGLVWRFALLGALAGISTLVVFPHWYPLLLPGIAFALALVSGLVLCRHDTQLRFGTGWAAAITAGLAILGFPYAFFVYLVAGARAREAIASLLGEPSPSSLGMGLISFPVALFGAVVFCGVILWLNVLLVSGHRGIVLILSILGAAAIGLVAGLVNLIGYKIFPQAYSSGTRDAVITAIVLLPGDAFMAAVYGVGVSAERSRATSSSSNERIGRVAPA